MPVVFPLKSLDNVQRHTFCAVAYKVDKIGEEIKLLPPPSPSPLLLPPPKVSEVVPEDDDGEEAAAEDVVASHKIGRAHV